MSGLGELLAITAEDAEKIVGAFNKHGDAIKIKRQKIEELTSRMAQADEKLAALGPAPDKNDPEYYGSEQYKLISQKMNDDSKIFDLEESLEEKEEKQANAVCRALASVSKQYRKQALDLDKAWDGIHRCLSGTQEFDDQSGDQPLSMCILGGKVLDVDDRVIRLVDFSQVLEVAQDIIYVTQEWFRSRYLWVQDPGFLARFSHSDKDFNYHWSCVPYIKEFYGKAAFDQKLVLFSSDV